MRLIDADALIGQYNKFALTAQTDYAEGVRDVINDINNAPSIDIVRCAECKHRPIKEDADEADHGFNLIAPNDRERCPCLVEDGWYSWMPDDNFYCGYGERSEP